MRFVDLLAVLVLGSLVLVGCSSSSSTPVSAGTDAGPGLNHGIGDTCPAGDHDCATGLVCDTSDHSGQCYKICTPSKDSDCGDVTKFACNYEGHCYNRCTNTTDCKRASEGYVCEDDTPARAVKFCDAAH